MLCYVMLCYVMLRMTYHVLHRWSKTFKMCHMFQVREDEMKSGADFGYSDGMKSTGNSWCVETKKSPGARPGSQLPLLPSVETF